MTIKIKYFFYAFIILLLITILIIVTTDINSPLGKPNEQIKNNLLEIFPLGTKMEYTIEKIESDYKKWTIRTVNNEHGYYVDFNGIPAEFGDICIGNKYIRLHVGEYFNPFETDVIAYFAFDENSNLIDISVRKDTDSF